MTTPLPSSASCSASCWCTAAGPTCACAASSATSSTRTLPSPWCTSGSASSAGSPPRSGLRRGLVGEGWGGKLTNEFEQQDIVVDRVRLPADRYLV